MDVKKCNVLAAEIRLETLKVIHSRGFGHVGGSMDLADLIFFLYTFRIVDRIYCRDSFDYDAFICRREKE